MTRLQAEAVEIRQVLLSLERIGVTVRLEHGEIVATGNLNAPGARAGIETLQDRTAALRLALSTADLAAQAREAEAVRRFQVEGGREGMRRRWGERKKPGPSKRTHCLRGHPFTPENTRTSKSGHRRCRACMREREGRRIRNVSAPTTDRPLSKAVRPDLLLDPAVPSPVPISQEVER